MFSDLHCHPAFRAFNAQRNTRHERNSNRFHPWYVGKNKKRKMKKGKRGTSYTQSDFTKLAESKTQLVFLSLYPLEKGFFIGKEGSEFDRNTMLEMCGYLQAKGLKKFWIKIKNTVVQGVVDKLLGNDRVLRDLAQHFYMRLPMKRINYIQNDRFDYWDEFMKEWDFYAMMNNQSFNYANNKNGQYTFVKSAQHLEGIEGEHNTIYCLPTIEGAHTFSIAPDGSALPFETISSRIKLLKSKGMFFITLAHHFNNELCGHAHSIPDSGKLVMDQGKNINAGMLPLGWQTVYQLLGINDKLETSTSPRILLDLKHTAAKARKELYEVIYTPYNEKNTMRKIPVIASHCGYAGVKTLNKLIDNADKEGDEWYIDGFNAWNINLCDEDIHAVYRSEGLIGLSFDQRILGFNPEEHKKLNNLKHREHELWADLLSKNILAFVDAVASQKGTREEKVKIWDMITIGTDFEGLIDPVNDYPTALQFPEFERELVAKLKAADQARYYLDIVSPEQAARKIAFDNALAFTRKHLKYNDEVLPSTLLPS